MRNMLAALAGAVAVTTLVPTVSFAQLAIDTPVGGVRIGEPHHHYHSTYGYTAPRYYDGPAVEHRVYRERSVGLGCRTVTVERDDGSVKRIRRCN